MSSLEVRLSKFDGLRWCWHCEQYKSVSEFNLSRGRPRGYCKICHRAMAIDYYERNPHKRRTNEYKNQHKCDPEHTRAYARAYYKKRTPEVRQKKAAQYRIAHLKRKYGLTQEQWDKMYQLQGGVCALCRIPGRTGRHNKLTVDHCHETGRVRGLLCAACNTAIGIFGEKVENIRRVLIYAESDFDGRSI